MKTDNSHFEAKVQLRLQVVAETLHSLALAGIKTWVSFEPVIIPEQSLNLLREVAPFINHVKIGKINQYKGIDKGIDWQKFIVDAVRICRDWNVPFYIKQDLRAFNRSVTLLPEQCDPDHLNL